MTIPAAFTAWAPLDGRWTPWVKPVLFAHLGHSETAVRFAAAKALGRINGPVVSRRLATLVERDTHRREALAALVYSRGKEAAEYLRAAQRYPELAGDIASVKVQAGL